MAKKQNNNWWINFYKKHPIISNICFIFVAGFILVLLAMFFLGIWTRHGETEEVPDVRNMPYDDAYKTLVDKGFRVEISDSVYDDNIKPGTVLESWPRPNAVVKPGREVFLTITSFQPRQVKITMPLRDVSSRQALSYLESLGIKNVRIVSVESQFADLVMGAKYNGREITTGMQLPVNSLIVLEVGTVPVVETLDVDSDQEAVSPQETIEEAVKSAAEDIHKEKTEEPSSSFYD